MKNIDQKLEILYDLIVDNYGTLETELKDLISTPYKIKNTNKFASLLSDLKNSTFINPLLLTISLSDGKEIWLCDFLYAAIDLLGESNVNEEFEFPENLINKLEIWILENKNELSWKSAGLLKYYVSESAEKIQLMKLEERGDFFLTYGECILGLLRFDKDKYWDLVKQISIDKTRDKNLIEFTNDIIKNYR